MPAVVPGVKQANTCFGHRHLALLPFYTRFGTIAHQPLLAPTCRRRAGRTIVEARPSALTAAVAAR